MKLLGWMQHKLRPSNIEYSKDFTIGKYCTCLLAQPSLNDQASHPKSTLGYGYESGYPSLSRQETEDSFTEFEGGGDNFGDEASDVISGLFHGFLAIGTLGSQRIIDEPVTPTFTTSWDNMTEERTEVTENDLKLVNDELGRFLEAEAEEQEQGSNQTSGRNSLVSTITISGKLIQEASAEEHEKPIICPLQGYLFGSSIELPETRFEVKKEKTSLAELFNNTKIAEENLLGKHGKEEIQAKQTNKPVKHLIKKILRKFNASPGNSTSPKETSFFSTKKKLQKVIKLFHRKIHPENSIAKRESKMNNGHYSDDYYSDGDQIQQAKDNMRFAEGSISKAKDHYTDCAAASEIGEHWINTDADYLVLEL